MTANNDDSRHQLAGKAVDGDEFEFYAVLGYAVTRWQYIEVRLCNIAACASCARNADAFASAFHQTTGFGARLSMVSAAVDHSPASEGLKTDWNRLAARLRRAASDRNAIAHGLVVLEPNEAGTQLVVIKPPQNPKNRAGLGQQGALGMYRSDLDAFLGHVNELLEEVRSFEWYLVKFLDYSDDPAIPSRFANGAPNTQR